MEAQRFPDDFDGIIAGAPATPWSRLAAWNVYIGQANLQDPAHTIPAAKYPMIHQAVLNACDALDGLKDGLIDDPRRCAFDFKVLECKGPDSPSCLTAAQVQSAQTITGPAIRSTTGETILHGLSLGTELGWGTKAGGPEPNPLGTDYFKYVVYEDPNWDWRSFHFDTAVAQADAIDGGTLNATSPDLEPFRRGGRKLLVYHGWHDQNFSPWPTLTYYKSVVEKMGASRIDDWLRVFLAPGMGHCGGGEGPNAFDPVTALEQWVEHGKAPDRIVAFRNAGGKVERTRPLCPYPQVAKYSGTGSIDDAANFSCGVR
jgi:feruloyl esterase